MKRVLFVIVAVLVSFQMSAQPPRKFDPEKFEIELQKFIVTEAALTPQDASVFFPVYKEMQAKQRVLFNEMRKYRHVDTRDDKASWEAIRNKDEIDLQIKKLQQQYHEKFCNILPAGTVFRIIKAEEKFHRQAFKRLARRR